jgi:hypothetical protein
MADYKVWVFPPKYKRFLCLPPYLKKVLTILPMTDRTLEIFILCIYWMSSSSWSRAGDQGKSHKPAYVMLVGTHADMAPARKNSNGEFSSPTQGILREKVGTPGHNKL